MAIDGQLLAKELNSSQSAIPVRHSRQNQRIYSRFSKTLDEFAEIPPYIMNYLLEFFRIDMKMFGYKWDEASHIAYCSIDTPYGPCC
jgi:hypothetical protein